MPLRGFAREQSKMQRKATSNELVQLGGLVEEEHPTAVRPTDLQFARNVCRRGRTTGTRPGASLGDADYNAAISGTPPIQGIYEFRRNRDADRDLVVVAGANVYSDDSTALDKASNSVTLTSGADYHWTFDTFQNKLFAAGGNVGTDDLWYWSGSGALGNLTASMTSAGTAPSAGARYVFAKWNYLFLGGFGGTAYNDNPLVARYCDWGTDATDGANWTATNVIPGQLLGENFGPGSYGREYNTGFGAFQDNRGDFLLFLTNRRLLSFVPNPNSTGISDAFLLADSIDAGCVHQNAFVNLGLDLGDCVYLSHDGVHSLVQSNQYGGRTNGYLSWPIRKTFDQLSRSRIKYASGAYWPNEGIVTFLVTTGSGSNHNLILAMDIKDATPITPDTVRWYKWDFAPGAGITPNILAACRGSDDKPYIYVGDTAGRVFLFGRNTYSDNNTAIPVRFATKNEDYGLSTEQKTVGDTFVTLQGAGAYNISHQYLFDDGQTGGKRTSIQCPSAGSTWGTTGTLVWGSGTWGGGNPSIRNRISGVGSSVTIAHEFSHSGLDEPFWVASVSQDIFAAGAAADSESNPVV